VLLTLSPLYSPEGFRARLACLNHTANVRSEPESNPSISVCWLCLGDGSHSLRRRDPARTVSRATLVFKDLRRFVPTPGIDSRGRLALFSSPRRLSAPHLGERDNRFFAAGVKAHPQKSAPQREFCHNFLENTDLSSPPDRFSRPFSGALGGQFASADPCSSLPRRFSRPPALRGPSPLTVAPRPALLWAGSRTTPRRRG
jgi:hypothetical protein